MSAVYDNGEDTGLFIMFNTPGSDVYAQGARDGLGAGTSKLIRI